jgi:hypothetical protein
MRLLRKIIDRDYIYMLYINNKFSKSGIFCIYVIPPCDLATFEGLCGHRWLEVQVKVLCSHGTIVQLLSITQKTMW